MVKRLAPNSLSALEVRTAAQIATTLRRLSVREFDLLFTHGYQVADATLSAYCGNTFQPIHLAPENRAQNHSIL